MPPIRQPSVSAGELAPSLWGRTDLPRYAAGCRRLFNFFVSKQGEAISRGGTQFLGTAWGGLVGTDFSSGDHTHPGGFTRWVAGGPVIRLIPFKWSDTDTTQNYMLEFGDFYFRPWKNGAPLTNAYYSGGPAWSSLTNYAKGFFVTSGGLSYQSLQDGNFNNAPVNAPTWWVQVDPIANSSPIAAADLPKLRYTQSGDVLTFACAGYAPFTITRLADNQWQPATISFARGPALDASGTTLAPQLDLGSLGTADASHPTKPWSWEVTSVRRDQRGIIYESAPVKVAVGIVADTWSSDVTYQIGSVVTVSGNNFFSIQQNNRNHLTSDAAWWSPLGAGGASTRALAQDEQIALYPDKQATLRMANTVVVSPDPLFITYRVYRGRSGVFGWVGDTKGPSFVDDGSDPDYEDAPPQGINPFEVYDDTGALVRTETPVAVTYYEDRLWFGGTIQRPMFLFGSAVGDYGNFDQRLIAVDDQSLVFALTSRERELVRALVGLNKLFALTNSGVWAIDGSQGPLTPTSIDAKVQVTVGADWAAPLLVEGAVLWVKDKGTGVRHITYDQETASFHSSDLSMTAEHLVLGHRIIDWCFQEDPWGMVWAVRDDGLLLSLTYAPEEDLWGWGQHGVCPVAPGALGQPGAPGLLQAIATIPEGDEDAVYLAMTGSTFAGGAAWVLRMSTRQEIDAFDPTLQDPIKVPMCLDAYKNPTVVSSTSRTVTVGGLDHLEGRAVWAVTDDGNKPHSYGYFGPYTVVSGQITIILAPPGQIVLLPAVITVGLPYQPEWEALDLAEARSGQKVVNEVVVEAKCVQPFLAGPDFTNLKPAPSLTSEVDIVRVPVRGGHNTGGRAAIRQIIPAPITIRAVTRKVSVAQE